jgi:multidrug efflux pump subunit AcrA (membrane-fusion protein)
MTPFRRLAFAGLTALALGLLAPEPRAGGDEPPKKAPRQPRLEAELNRVRALEPGDRLKLVVKLAGTNDPFTATRRGDLAGGIFERGVVEPVDYAELVCTLKARGKEGVAATIKWVVDDGRVVKKGDRLLLLDNAELRGQLKAAAAKAKEADEALELVTENGRLAQKEAAIDVRLAEIDVKLAEAELKELPAGRPKEMPELRVEQAKLKLERAGVRARAQQVQAEAEKRARAAAKELAVERQRDLEAELKQCTLVAPADGLVVYHVPEGGRFGRVVSPVAAGEGVREGQKLMRVVGLKQFALATRVHESQVGALRVGQPAEVRVDAFPDKQWRGKVAQVSAVAEATGLAADVKLYPVTVAIEGAPAGLSPQMSGEVRIPTGERKGVLQIPRTAIAGAGRECVCFVKSGQELIERKVVLGASGATAFEIKEGLKEGDLVIADLPALLLRP